MENIDHRTIVSHDKGQKQYQSTSRKTLTTEQSFLMTKTKNRIKMFHGKRRQQNNRISRKGQKQHQSSSWKMSTTEQENLMKKAKTISEHFKEYIDDRTRE